MREFQSTAILLAVLMICIIAGPAGAIKIYLNPSDQIHNESPDGTYNEAASLKIIAQMLETKLRTRGFEVQNSDGKTMADSCAAANAWPADIFISLHTNAGAGPGWGKAHGTNTIYFQPRDGSPPNPISIELATRCDEKCVEKFTTYDRGYNFRITADIPFLGYNLYVLRKTNMPGTLVEGLFHDNMEDTTALKTEEGKDAYTQGVYEALCDYFGWSYYPDAPLLDPVGPVTNNADGRLEFAAPGSNGHMLHCSQTGINGAWSGTWLDIKCSSVSNSALARNAQGKLQVFYRGPGNRVWHKYQSSAGSAIWNGWYDLGGRMASDPTIGRNADGRLDVFALGSDKHMFHKIQRSPTSSLAWGGWYDLGGPGVTKPAVAANADGRLMIFSRDSAGNIWSNTQHAANSLDYDGWASLGGPVSGDPVVINDGGGRLAVFALGSDSHIRYKVQKIANSADWDDWQDIGGMFIGNPAVCINTDGRLEVFARDAAGTVLHKYQDSSGSRTWSEWIALKGTFTSDPMTARNKDGRIEVFARGNGDGKIWRRVQREPAKSAIWDGWYILGDDVSRF